MPDPCGKCRIDVGDDESIACDACGKWYHSDKLCSGLKRTMFRLITSKDKWLCPPCVDFSIENIKNDVVGSIRLKLEEYELKLRRLSEVSPDLEISDNLCRPNTNCAENFIDCVSTQRTVANPVPLVDSIRPKFSVVERPHKPNRTNNALVTAAVGGERSGQTGVRDKKQEGTFGKVGNSANCYNDRLKRGIKVHLVTDSQGRSFGSLMTDKLDSSFSTIASVYPGATLCELVEREKSKSEDRTLEGDAPGDWTVFMGGTNDVERGDLDGIIGCIEGIESELSGKNVIFLEVPCRHDKPSLNVKVNDINLCLREKCIKNKWGFLATNSLLNRDCFTKHGLHLTPKGKDIICDLIATYITLSVKN